MSISEPEQTGSDLHSEADGRYPVAFSRDDLLRLTNMVKACADKLDRIEALFDAREARQAEPKAGKAEAKNRKKKKAKKRKKAKKNRAL